MKVPVVAVVLLQLRHGAAFAPEAMGPSSSGGSTSTCLHMSSSQQHPAWEGKPFGAWERNMEETSPWSDRLKRPPLKSFASSPDSVGGRNRNGFDVEINGRGPRPPMPLGDYRPGFRDPAFYPDGRSTYNDVPPPPPPGVFDPAENPGGNGSSRDRDGPPFRGPADEGGPMWGPPRGLDPLGGTSGGRGQMPFSYKERESSGRIQSVKPYVERPSNRRGGASSSRDRDPMPGTSRSRRGERNSMGTTNNLGGTSASQGRTFYAPERRDDDPMSRPSVGNDPMNQNHPMGFGGSFLGGRGGPSSVGPNPLEPNLGGTSASQGRTFYAPERRRDDDPMGSNLGGTTTSASSRGRTSYPPDRPSNDYDRSSSSRSSVGTKKKSAKNEPRNLGGTSSSQGRTFYAPERLDDGTTISGTNTRRSRANGAVETDLGGTSSSQGRPYVPPPEARRDDDDDRVSRPRGGGFYAEPGPGPGGPARGDGFDMYPPPPPPGEEFDDGPGPPYDGPGPPMPPDVQSAVVSVVDSNLGEIAETLLFDLWEGDEREVISALTRIADAYGTEENRRRVFEAGGHTVVLKTMRKWYKTPSIQAEGCRAIQNLCLENGVPENVAADLGAFDVVCTAMKNFPSNERVQECGCGALLNLSRYETGADRFMRHKDGWYCLTSAMNEFPANRDLQYWAISTIRDISRYEKHRRQLVREGYLNIILDEITVAYGEDKQMYDAARLAMANLLTLDVQE